ncbi:MAG: MraY family glycosyltransferase [Candidatus Zixiibacteriota bacterium]
MIPADLVVIFFVSAVVTAISIPIAIRASERFALLDFPGRHKRHKRPVPFLGGVVLFLALWGGIVTLTIISDEFWRELAGPVAFVYAGAVLVFLVGLFDDLRPLSAWVKLLAEAVAGLLLFAGGLGIDPLSIPFYGEIEVGGFSALLTILWVVALTNAINLIDGLDGLAAGVSLIGAITLSIIGGLYDAWSALVFTLPLSGFLAVFLFWNRYPARIFLGDSGALQIGYYFAVVSLLVRFKSFTAAALYVPLIALGVPLLETGLSFVRRMLSGRNVMQADRRHLFHYLGHAGLTPRQIVLFFYLLSAVFGLFALAMFLWNRLVVFGFLVLFMVVILVGIFIFMSGSARWKRARGNPPNGSPS